MSQRVHRGRRVVGRRIEGRMVLVSAPSLETRVLNEIGGLVWELADGRTIDELVHALATELDADPAVLARDVGEFIDALVSEQLLRLD